MSRPGFREATAVSPGGSPGGSPGRWAAHLPPTWNVPTGVHGGVLAATALRAGALELADPVMGLRSGHVSFLSRPEGPGLDLTATVGRRGKTTAHVDVVGRDATDDARDAVAVRALFARSRGGDGWLDALPPEVPDPDDLPPDDGAGGDGGVRDSWPLTWPPVFDQLDLRTAGGGVPVGGRRMGPEVPARHLRWSRYRDATAAAGPDGEALDPLALLPLADLPGPSVWARGPGPEGMRVMVSLELTAWFLEPVREPWVLTDTRARWLGDGYVLAGCDCWSGGRLVARVEQLMLVRHLPV